MKTNALIQVWPDPQRAAEALAAQFLLVCQEAVAQKGQCLVALSGGHSPEIFFRTLTQPAYRRNLPWKQVHFFWSDERFVPLDHPDSNYGMAKENLLHLVPVPPKNIHATPVKGKPETCAAQYEKTIRSVAGSSKPVFDWLMLGTGPDGHTASLFPGTDILKENKKLVSEVFVKEKNSWRISFTYPLINLARKVVILVQGEDKKEIIHRIFREKKALPVKKVKPVKGELIWVMDEAAAAGL